MSADGRYLAYRIGDQGAGRILYVDLTDTEAAPTAYTHGFAVEPVVALSPVSNLAAIVAFDRPGGRIDLWVSRFPSGDDLSLVATDLDLAWTTWSADGQRLYFVRHSSLVEVAVRPGPEGMTLSDPVELFDLPERGISPRSLTANADGSRFLVGGRQNSQTFIPNSLVLIQNWPPPR